MTADLAFILPMLEMAGDRAKYVKDILYIYNGSNPQSDSKTNPSYQLELDNYYRAKASYQKIESLDLPENS